MEQLEPAFDYVSPGIEINTKLGKFVLTHFNTRIRRFLPPNEHFDHIEFEYEDGDTRKLIGFTPDAETMQIFEDKAFPKLLMPFVDYHTNNWLVRTLSKDLREAISPHDVGIDPDEM